MEGEEVEIEEVLVATKENVVAVEVEEGETRVKPHTSHNGKLRKKRVSLVGKAGIS